MLSLYVMYVNNSTARESLVPGRFQFDAVSRSPLCGIDHEMSDRPERITIRLTQVTFRRDRTTALHFLQSIEHSLKATGELAITRRISLVAVCCSRAS